MLTMRNRLIRWCLLGVTLLVVQGLAASAYAEEQTLEGEIVDPAGYLKEGARGSDLADQTYEAVDGGQTLALLADDDRLYLLLAEEPGEDPNELVYDYVNQQVRLNGIIYERSGLRGIVPLSVEPVEPPASSDQSEEPQTPSAPLP